MERESSGGIETGAWFAVMGGVADFLVSGEVGGWGSDIRPVGGGGDDAGDVFTVTHGVFVAFDDAGWAG
jgi:hypothetical protein